MSNMDIISCICTTIGRARGCSKLQSEASPMSVMAALWNHHETHSFFWNQHLCRYGIFRPEGLPEASAQSHVPLSRESNPLHRRDLKRSPGSSVSGLASLLTRMSPAGSCRKLGGWLRSTGGPLGHGSGSELAGRRIQRQLGYIQGALTLEG